MHQHARPANQELTTLATESRYPLPSSSLKRKGHALVGMFFFMSLHWATVLL